MDKTNIQLGENVAKNHSIKLHMLVLDAHKKIEKTNYHSN